MFTSNPSEGCQAANIPPGQITLLRLTAVLKRRGRSRSSHYADIKAGLFVKPVLIGLRATGTPDHEVDVLNGARIAGKTDEEIISTLYQLALARDPAAAEMEASKKHIAGSSERRPALEDIGWALLNSNEFLFQH